jgi:hypothetical protein
MERSDGSKDHFAYLPPDFETLENWLTSSKLGEVHRLMLASAEFSRPYLQR